LDDESRPTDLAKTGKMVMSKSSPEYIRIKPKDGVGQVNLNKVEDVYFDKWQAIPLLANNLPEAKKTPAPFISQRDWRLNELRKDTNAEEYTAGSWHEQENNVRFRPTLESANRSIAIWEGARAGGTLERREGRGTHSAPALTVGTPQRKLPAARPARKQSTAGKATTPKGRAGRAGRKGRRR
jgi:hypothetical protein